MVATKKVKTNTTMIIKKNTTSWCKFTIFHIMSLAGDWKFICQALGSDGVNPSLITVKIESSSITDLPNKAAPNLLA